MWFSNQSSLSTRQTSILKNGLFLMTYTLPWTSNSRGVYSLRPRWLSLGRGDGAKLKWISLQESVYLQPILVL